VDTGYYVLRKDGVYAGVSLWESYEASKPHAIAVHDGTKRLEKAVALFKGPSLDFPPKPKVPAEVMKESK
jgi:N4-(beta-N-acetylglucosaminyl)-L-asparaginase